MTLKDVMEQVKAKKEGASAHVETRRAIDFPAAFYILLHQCISTKWLDLDSRSILI